MIATLLQVALGGALGASARWLTGLAVLRLAGGTALPLPILTVNVLGSVLLGSFVALATARGLMHWSPLVMTGFLGGFTTFSTFSYEVVTLIERGQVGLAAGYAALSVGLSVGGLALGMALMRAALG